MLEDMPDNETDDWLAESTIEATSSDLTFFDGLCLPIDTSCLPEPDNDDLVA